MSQTFDTSAFIEQTTPRPGQGEAIQRHNARVGTPLQGAVQKMLLLWLLGPVAWLGLRLLFRVRVLHRERLSAVFPRGILAARHFFEWDPLVTFYAAGWTSAFRHPELVGHAIAGRFWMRNWLWRAVSWCLGILGYRPGGEPDEGAVGRAADLLDQRRRVMIAVYPTGPIGRSREYRLRPSVGELASRCPAVPILPLTVVGLQTVRVADVLFLRRPRLTLALGEAFCAADLPANGEPDTTEAVCARIDAEWKKLEEGLNASRGD